MTSLSGPKNQSTHGRVLLTELRDRTSARLDFVLECLQKDPLSGRLKCTETGNTAYHWLLIGNYPLDFTTTVLAKLLEASPQGVKTVNNNGSLPLHLCLTANRLCQSTIDTLLAAYPAGAGIADTQGLIPLFLCCMREDATADICRALCKAFPNGPSTKNKTNSFPLHFAAKRKVPNLDILRILIRRNPTAAGAVNDFGLLPMHCITALSDNVQAVELIHSADESAVKVSYESAQQRVLPLDCPY
jgi:ankyrin repeat protein